MPNEKPPAQPFLSQGVQRELQELLARLNRPPARFSFLDHPFVVTFIGGVILAALAGHWHSVQQRTNLQLELMRKFSTVFDTDANLLNSWLAHLVWVAQEKNKGSAGDQKKIKSWSADIADAQRDFYKSQSLDDIVIPIQTVFHSREVRMADGALGSKWDEFRDLMMNTSRDYDDGNEMLSPAETKSAENSRRKIVDELNVEKGKLLKALAAELSD